MTSGKVDMKMCALQKSNKLHVSSRLFRLVYKKLSHSKIKSQHLISHCECKGYEWKNRGKHAGVCFLLKSLGLLFRKDTTTADKITAFRLILNAGSIAVMQRRRPVGIQPRSDLKKAQRQHLRLLCSTSNTLIKGSNCPPAQKNPLCRLMPHFHHAAN